VPVRRRVRRGQLVSQEQGRAQVLPEWRAWQVLRERVQPGLRGRVQLEQVLQV
jgi:hypothetical protein